MIEPVVDGFCAGSSVFGIWGYAVRTHLIWPNEIDSSKKVAVTVDYIHMGKEISEVIPASCVEPLLNSLERSKLPFMINSGCRSGECALCRSKLISGKVYVPPIATIREIDEEYGFIHPCISYPIEDLHLDLRIT